MLLLYVESKIIQTNVYGKTEVNIKKKNKKLVVTCRERKRRGACQGYDIKRYKLLCIKQTTRTYCIAQRTVAIFL